MVNIYQKEGENGCPENILLPTSHARSKVEFLTHSRILNALLASAFIVAICRYSADDLAIKSWDEYR
ncbi:MAG TPA: hypothetical protein VLH37_06125 [Bacteroidales bacterium]|nr:hypothetical protein [Bacteroidales bacterium]